jgi:excisionase family DNA binding protein
VTRRPPLDFEPLLTPAEVADIFRVAAKTVRAWEQAGQISAVRTIGGHRRYREADIRALLDSDPDPIVAAVQAMVDGQGGGGS